MSFKSTFIDGTWTPALSTFVAAIECTSPVVESKESELCIIEDTDDEGEEVFCVGELKFNPRWTDIPSAEDPEMNEYLATIFEDMAFADITDNGDIGTTQTDHIEDSVPADNLMFYNDDMPVDNLPEFYNDDMMFGFLDEITAEI